MLQGAMPSNPGVTSKRFDMVLSPASFADVEQLGVNGTLLVVQGITWSELTSFPTAELKDWVRLPGKA